MTASLPVPREPLPDEPDESVARTGDGEIVEITKGSRSGASESSDRTPTPRPKRPAKPRAPRKRTPRVAPDPGPPPPLPPEFDATADESPADETSTPDSAVEVLVIESTIDDVEIVIPPKPELPAEPVSDDVIVPPRPAAPAVVAASVVADDVIVPPKPELPVAEDVAEAEAEAETEVEAAAEIEDAVDEEIDAAIEIDLAEAELDELVTADPTEPDTAVDETEPAVVESEPEELVEAAEAEALEVEAVETLETVEVGTADDVVEMDELVEPDVDVVEFDDVDDLAALAAVFPDAQDDASPDEDTAALVLRGVSKRFGETRAVEGIDLTVPAGSFYGLVGPNGAGKTTTLSMIAGLLAPDRGTVRVGGIDAASDPLGAKRVLGVLPDRLRTFDRLTGRQLLYYYGVLRGLSSSVVASRTADLARAFDLTDALGRVVSDYSAGMIKKVMLAGAMIHSPRVLVLDEPFEAVDPVSSAVILDILSAYVAHGGTVILSSHGMDLVERVCTRVAVIVGGQVLAEGTVEEVRGELTLEQRFIELAGGLSDVEGLEWLHTFSD